MQRSAAEVPGGSAASAGAEHPTRLGALGYLPEPVRSFEVRLFDQSGAPFDFESLGDGAQLVLTKQFPNGKWGELERRGPDHRLGSDFFDLEEGLYAVRLHAGIAPSNDVRNRPRARDLRGGPSGVAGTGLIQFDPEQGELVLELRLSGDHLLRGRVVDKTGAPCPGLEVILNDTSLALDEPRVVSSLANLPPWWFEAGLTSGTGIGRARALTDEDGRFELLGMTPGPFDAYVVSRGAGAEPMKLNAAPLRTGEDRHELVFGSGTLVVQVFDADGARRSDLTSIGLSRYDLAGPRLVQKGVRVWIERGWPAVGGAALVASSVPLGTIVPGDLVCYADLERGPWRVCAVSIEHGVFVREVELGPGRTDVRIDLPAPRELATLEVDVLDTGGLSLEKREVLIVVTERASGQRVFAHRWHHFNRGEEDPRLRLPAGAYWVDAEVLPEFGYHGGVIVQSPGAVRVALDVEPGRDERVVARLQRPAYLEVLVRGPAPEVQGEDASHAELFIRRPGEAPRELDFLGEAEGWMKAMAGGPVLSNRVKLGEARKSEALPHGSFIVEARLPSGRSVAQSVELAGSPSSVVLAFD